ncbi:T9SS type A sorting domain-containing protein [Luteibaculum oceani]|uniref:T9SS type A sorting domain-containing protein n=1 Tax=Luteibaculum oceani TaxID=1294296 RepID=A0A5C6VK06_9FLAO|nr:T9SS type A sorting domain-containing protein [Luteibaculum oceani]TXC85380.1 T9SS type A sorting domain-containing protein [Luteibaculum oceani]
MRFLFLFIATISFSSLFAQPKYFRTMWRADPSTSMVVGWSQTPGSINNGISFELYYATTDFGTDLSLYKEKGARALVDRSVSAFKGLDHYFVRLANLSPKTPYYFVLVYRDALGREQVSDRYWFKTASDNPSDPISIIAGGDSRLNVDGGPVALAESVTIRQEANRIVAKLRPDMVAFGGDYTFANTEQEWDAWFADWELTYTDDNKITPIVAAMGNHEASPFGCPDCGNFVVERLFDTPHPDVYYALSFNGNLLRMYTLNTEMTISGEQTDWLNNDLDSVDGSVYWKIAQYHKPIRPHHSSKSDKNDAFDNWAEPFYEKQVRLVVECDAHVVKTTWPLIPTRTSSGTTECGKDVDHNYFIAENGRGTVYVGEGTWAAIRMADDAKTWTRDMGTLNQVKWIWVNKNEIQVRSAQTYFPDNPNYASSVTPLTEENRFMVPDGLSIWEPENGAVTIIKNNGLTPLPERCATTNVAEELERNEALMVMPNPTRNKNFRIKAPANSRVKAFEILGLDSRLVWKKTTQSNFVDVNLSEYNSGAYFAKVVFEDGKSEIVRFILD